MSSAHVINGVPEAQALSLVSLAQILPSLSHHRSSGRVINRSGNK
jgi:hypothetical protein